MLCIREECSKKFVNIVLRRDDGNIFATCRTVGTCREWRVDDEGLIVVER